MKNYFILFFSSVLLFSCSIKKEDASFKNQHQSIKVNFDLDADKKPFYQVYYHDKKC